MRNKLAISTCLFLVFLFAVSCLTSQNRAPSAAHLHPGLAPALESITTNDLLRHIKVLASDEFEGRAPGTRGEDLTVDYLVAQFKSFGLEPGGEKGTYLQAVPLMGFAAERKASLVVKGQAQDLRFPEDYVAVSRHFVPEVQVADSDLIFVGYGVVAPEYGWDDYKGQDVRGKTLVMLINDPAVPAPGHPDQLDPKMFKGRAMTYYGRWTYKYEIASAKGAAAAIIIHETGPAGYPYEVVSGSWGRENFDIQTPNRNQDRVKIEAWLHLDRARELFKACGVDYDALKQSARQREFRPVPLPAKANFQVKNQLRAISSRNVMARLTGSDPQLRNEYVIYTAHWDHLGRDPKLPGDQIFNGAVDNASGTAGLLELAQAFAKLPERPKRSILFLSVTAEEKGLLGSKFYAAQPLYPLERTLANINMDGLNQWGPTRDIISIGLGNTTLDEILSSAAASRGRVVKPDAEPEKGFFYRSDHFEFAKKGVPALDPDSGVEYLGKPAGYGESKRQQYTEKDYHKVSDEVKPDWDLSGAVADLQLLWQVGWTVANGKDYPRWKPETEFKAVREKMLKASAP